MGRVIRIDRDCLEDRLLPTVLGVYPKETMGYLLGASSRSHLVEDLYTEQTAERGRGEVFHGRGRAEIRAVFDYFSSNGVKVVGGFHSHPNRGTSPSKDDLKSAEEELEFARGFRLRNSSYWIEVIVGVRRESGYPRWRGVSFQEDGPELCALIATPKKWLYSVTIGGYVMGRRGWKEAEEAPVRVSGRAGGSRMR